MKANRDGGRNSRDLLFHVFDFSILGLLLLDDDIILVVYEVSAKFLPLLLVILRYTILVANT